MGIFEKIKGKAKEVAGEVTDDGALEQEGKAQAAKGDEQIEATKAKAEAKVHEAKAKEKELEQAAAAESK